MRKTMERLTWQQKYSKKTTSIYVRLSATGMVGFGFLILTLLTGVITRPRFSEAYIAPLAVAGAFFAAAIVCIIIMCVLLARFFASARADRQRRNAGLPVNPEREH